MFSFYFMILKGNFKHYLSIMSSVTLVCVDLLSQLACSCLDQSCLFSLLKVPPPKPPRRQGGWADDPVLASTKWVHISFLIKRDLGVE